MAATPKKSINSRRATMRRRICRFMGLIADDHRGNVAITFGLMFSIMLMAVGGAIDIGRWLHAKSRTLEAVDAAVLAGGRMLQIKGGDTLAAIASATAFYQQNVRERPSVINITIKFTPSDDGTSFSARGNAFINTPFLSIAGIDKLPLIDESTSEFAKSVLAVGGNAHSSIEISMMLDITGSMAGQKLADLKEAAKDLINIVIWADQSEYTSRVALVPFSESVNLGAYADSVRGPVTNTGTTTTFNSTVFKSYQFSRQGGGTSTYQIGTCVTERTGTDAYTDAAPATVAARVRRAYPATNGSCNPSSIIIPLTSDKTALKTAINAYVADGFTAGHLGTAWAWYMLSPNWGYLWPSSSRPESYSKLSELNADGEPKLRKIAILMTDGEYNQQYCNGVADRNTSESTRISCASPNGSSTSQARLLCSEMKKKGVSVYSIGFALGGNTTATTTLRDHCASNTSMFYLANSGDQLRQAFRDIALKISTLYLSK